MHRAGDYVIHSMNANMLTVHECGISAQVETGQATRGVFTQTDKWGQERSVQTLAHPICFRCE